MIGDVRFHIATVGLLPYCFISTGIVVSALARPEWLVEIDATAVLAA